MDQIANMIYAIPESENDIEIISKARKEFYVKGMEIRLQELLIPAWKHIQEINKNLNKFIRTG